MDIKNYTRVEIINTNSCPALCYQLIYLSRRRMIMLSIMPMNVSRKIDTLGRVVIPKGIRDTYKLNIGDEVYFSILNNDGQQYVGISKTNEDLVKYKIAMQVLLDLDLDVPEELAEKVENIIE